MNARARMTLIFLLTLVVHLTVLSRVRVLGVRPDALLLLSVVAGLVGGTERGAVAGFLSGLLADLFLQSPFGLSALVYSLVGFSVGSIQSAILRAVWWIPVVTALAASTAGTVLYALVAAMVGQPEFVSPRLPLIAGLVGVMNAALAPVAVRLLSWSFRPGGVDRPYAL